MHAGETSLHYAPTSVGALMDPTFLRGAVLDAEGGYRAGVAPSRALFARSVQAMRRLRMRMRSDTHPDDHPLQAITAAGEGAETPIG